ncbi:MAG: hypothetical protein ACD_3C00154G0010 [uncultured bacterium (gcode 4)]|uniref:Uncharacterized protein n=1 Tax=uncultured bacterium (gcode 4) TaxID=1234023 RepID=K2G0S5_9BACT|nr:MAG: hypothetical protein ACD_3C00154G0010 [uncultured bacterium (gcode 4)]
MKASYREANWLPESTSKLHINFIFSTRFLYIIYVDSFIIMVKYDDVLIIIK